MSQKIEELCRQYLGLHHAIQSAVQFELSSGGEVAAGATPKMLRTGLNIAMVDHGGLVALLIEKGVITDEEYYTFLVKYAEKEVTRYEKIHTPLKFK